MTDRSVFEQWYAREQKPLLQSVKESHWQTWQEAQRSALADQAKREMALERLSTENELYNEPEKSV